MLKEYFRLFRILQWIKNLFVFVPLIFSQHLFNGPYFLKVFFAFLVFCLSSSIVYIINDIFDVNADSQHPHKKFRPLPTGKISIKKAYISALLLTIPVLSALPFFNWKFNLILLSFFLLNFSYTFYLKHIVLLDLFSIAAGFMIRIIAGAFAINVEISSWLILTTMFISLFLAVMKRRSELRHVAVDEEITPRKVLAFYSTNLADQIATVAAAGVIICYALYTVSERTIAVFHTDNLIFTTPFVVFGIFRYLYLVVMVQKGENTSEIMVTDLPMILNILLYILTTTFIIYVPSL